MAETVTIQLAFGAVETIMFPSLGTILLFILFQGQQFFKFIRIQIFQSQPKIISETLNYVISNVLQHFIKGIYLITL